MKDIEERLKNAKGEEVTAMAKKKAKDAVEELQKSGSAKSLPKVKASPKGKASAVASPKAKASASPKVKAKAGAAK